MLNKFFSSCFGPATLEPSAISQGVGVHLSTSHVEVLSDLECTSVDVLRILSRLQENKAIGLDGISARMLKKCGPVIAEHLAALFNRSWATGVVLSPWKVSRVTPVPKSGDSSLADNYRPISLLSLVGKVPEWLVHEVLLGHLLEFEHLSSLQFGFRPHSST